MKRYGVRPTVCPSVCSSVVPQQHPTLLHVCCCGPGGQEISIDFCSSGVGLRAVQRCQRYPYSHTYYYGYSISHSLFHSRLKSFLFCKSSLPQPFLFLFRIHYMDFPDCLLSLLSISVSLLFSFFLLFLHFFSCRFRAVD